jgi:hypothetical protein
MYINQSIKVRVDQAELKSKTMLFSPILVTLDSQYLTNEALIRSGNFKTEEQAIRTVKCTDDLGLMVKEETVLESMIDRTKQHRYIGHLA